MAVKLPNGDPMQRPYVTQKNKQVDIMMWIAMMRIAAEFGILPSSRTRIRLGDKPASTPRGVSARRWLEREPGMTRSPPNARAVTDRQILTNRRAFERHFDGLAGGVSRSLRFDPRAAQDAIDFSASRATPRVNGQDGTFPWSPWHAFMVGCRYGWSFCPL
jgi:hypothetical protein